MQVATAHGASLQNLMKNPPLRGLIGGIKATTLGDAAAKERSQNFNGSNMKKKTVLERAGAPIFNYVIELLALRRWRIYRNVGKVVDDLLAGKWCKTLMMLIFLGQNPIVEERWQTEDGSMFSRFEPVKGSAFDERWFEAKD